MKTKKMVSLFLAIVMVVGMVAVMPISSLAAATDSSMDDNSSATQSGIIVPWTQSGTAKVIANGDIVLDLTKETLVVKNFEVAAYSLDGSKWKVGSLGDAEGADISKLLNKGMTLKLTNAWDSKKKQPQAAVAKTEDSDAIDAATTITFSKIAARPKAPKLAVNYLAASIESKETTDGGKTFDGFANEWRLTEKGKDVPVYDNLSIAPSTDGKIPEEGKTWKAADVADEYFYVKDLGEDGKPVKSTYLVRLTENEKSGLYTPGSKASKVKVSSNTKGVAVKLDYKKEVIKFKAGMITDLVMASGKYTTIVKDKALVEAATAIDDGGFEYCVAPTAKKPASVWVRYIAGERGKAEFTGTLSASGSSISTESSVKTLALSASNGKLTLDKKTYEVYDGAKKKWGGLPKIQGKKLGNAALEIRLKATGKAQKLALIDYTFTTTLPGGGKDNATETSITVKMWAIDDSEQIAAGEKMGLYIDYGKIDPSNAKSKSGILAATITSQLKGSY